MWPSLTYTSCYVYVVCFQDSTELKMLFFAMIEPQGGLNLSAKRYRLRTFTDCFFDNDLISWLIENDHASDPNQAMVIGQALLDAKYLICLNDSSGKPFQDNCTIYKLRDLTLSESRNKRETVRRVSLYPQIAETEPNWVQELEHTDSLGKSCTTWFSNSAV